MSHETKNLGEPEETVRFPGISEDLIEIGGMTVGRTVQEPGWRWSTDMQPLVGGDWCEARHIGVTISGRHAVALKDGTVLEYGPDDVYDIPPGHDGYTIGDEPAIMIEWGGLRTFVGAHRGYQGRVLRTILFTDIVESTATAARLGDVAWTDVMARHLSAVRAELERYRGREIETTGDGLLVTFEGPAAALRCAAAVVAGARGLGLHVRAGVHVGEVELVGDGLRGVAVHEAARIMAAAGSDEILVSETTRSVAVASGLRFEDRGLHGLRGFDGDRRLFALAAM